MSSVSIEQKVRQLDNDVHAIYDMLATIAGTQMRHTNRFSEISADLAEHTVRLDSLDGKLDGLNTKVESLDAKVESLGAKLESLDAKVETLDAKVETLDSKVDRVLDLLQD